MNKHYVLTPIGEVEGLPDGNYVVQSSNKIERMFFRKCWHGNIIERGFTHYLRPITDGIVISEEKLRETLFEFGRGMFFSPEQLKDRINSIISKLKDNGK